MLGLAVPISAAAAPSADRQDLVYLGPGGPWRLRLHVQLDGQAVSERWQMYLDRVFKHFDANGDGSLDAKEFARLAAFPFRARTGENLEVLADADDDDADGRGLFKLAEADADKDGKVTPPELRTLFRKRGLGPLAVSLLPPDTAAGQLSDALWRHLDTDKDGKITQAEAEAALAVLTKLDLDEDDIVTREELLEQPPQANPRPRVPAAPNDEADDNQSRGDFLVVGADEAPAALAKRLIERLAKGKEKSKGKAKDKDKSAALTRAQSGFDEKRFTALDKDGNGKLDAAELAAWLGQPPDLELRLALSANPRRGQQSKDAAASVAVWSPDGQPSALAEKVLQQDGGLRLELAGAVIEVNSGPETRVSTDPGQRLVLDQFKQVAGDKKFIEKKQLRDQPALQGLTPFFDSADRNGDGKLDLEELTGYLKLVESGAGCQAVLRISDGGRGLFELVDADRDGRLSVREMRNVWKVLSAYDLKGQKQVGRDQLPHGYAITPDLAALANVDFGGRLGLVTGMTVSRPGRSAVGPGWFRKMDRNGDGDVSAKEFLGPPALFRKLDKDGDGLISLQEAIEAEKNKSEDPKD